MTSSERRANNRSYFGLFTHKIIAEIAAEDPQADAGTVVGRMLLDEYKPKLAEEIREFVGQIFRNAEATKIIRETCKRVLTEIVAEVLEMSRAEIRADVELVVREKWKADVESVAQAALAEELARIKSRIIGGRT